MRKTLLAIGFVACAPSGASSAPAPAASYPPPSYGAPAYPPYATPPAASPYPTAAPPSYGSAAPAPVGPAPVRPAPTAPPQAAPVPIAARPLLPPLLGPLAWTTEVQSVVVEDIAALGSDNQPRVRGLSPDLDPSLDVNAYASCDAQGSPHITGTQGLLYVMDAIAQTKACDELYATHTYDAYTAAVIPQLIQPGDASPALPPNILPSACVTDVHRWSRAHEWFDEIASFTFGHELAHHYLGHTGCAYGSPPLGSAVALLMGSAGHVFAQPLENMADVNGVDDALNAGVARSRSGQYRWTEEGALALLDFFKRMETSVPVGQQIFVGFEGNHPPATNRLLVVQGAVNVWHFTHPG